ncbi:hypothetical protein BJF79_16925 [Actinomadura sp. CNU-125]|nr:hypothetical protein BJF79_16925 [Actinomadura sp. CNU-125]
MAGNLCRSACGALGCTAAAGVISIGAPAAGAEAAHAGEPRPRRQVSAACNHPERIRAAPFIAPAVHEPGDSAEPSRPVAVANAPGHTRPSPVRSPVGPLETVLFLLLLLPVIAGICYPLRRRAAARTRAAEPAPRTVLRCRPPFDPFAIEAVGLAGPGALATARVMGLAALGTHTSSLVVIPRPDAIRMFGLDEDEFLDDDITELFIPGNLDAALAYLETELAIRKNAGKPAVPRLLLIADCAGETDRIHELLARHQNGVSAILMGPWTGDRATITAGGLVIGPPDETELPDRLPTMSTMQARDLLHAAAVPPPVRKRPSRRP